jgi:hypothetical protein
VHEAGTLEALAPLIGADGARLAAVIAKYNTGSTSDEGVPPRGARPELSRGPFYALGQVKKYINYTDGVSP